MTSSPQDLAIAQLGVLCLSASADRAKRSGKIWYITVFGPHSGALENTLILKS
jgi:hypothetical protein